jgi:dihydroneopterin aldolase
MQIFVEGLEFRGAHGVYPEERRQGRRFRADVRVEVDAGHAADSDDLGDTLDYRDLAEIVLEHGDGPSCHLIERLAEQIVDTILERHASVEHVWLTLRKYADGVPGEPECVGVRLERARADSDSSGC